MKTNLDKHADLIFIGRFPFGDETVQLLAKVKEFGGEYSNRPDTKLHPKELPEMTRIVVGIGANRWGEVLEVLLHEAFELAFGRLHCRFEPADMTCGSMARFLFVATHEQFAEAVTRTADFIAKSQTALHSAWNQWKVLEKKAKRAKKKKR